jgi:hypothetical protein
MYRNDRGFVLLASALILLALAGFTGLSIDVGHLYAVRAEAQSYADSVALTAARELDGTRAGVDRARESIEAIPVTGLLKVTPWNLETEFSADGATWEREPSRPASLHTVRAHVALESVPLFFLPAVIPNKTASVHVVAVAEQRTEISDTPSQMLPYAIFARAAEAADYGYKPDEPVTLRWSENSTGCLDSIPVAAPGDGYIQGIARDRIREAIEDGRVDIPVEKGKPVQMMRGDLYQQRESLAERARQDTNLTAESWVDYQQSPGNGRRLAAVAVIDSRHVVLGFVQVLLPPDQPDSGALCANYVGSQSQQPAAVSRYSRLVR